MSVVYSDASTPPSVAPGPGFAIKHVDGLGRELNFEYDANGNMTKLITPAGQAILYTHEPVLADGCERGTCYRLKTVEYAGGPTRTYHYNEPAQTGGANMPLALTGITDERGIRVGTYSYDSSNRVTATQGANGVGSFTLSYPSSIYTSVTDPLGSVRGYTSTTRNQTKVVYQQSQPAGAGCAASTEYLSYDSNSNIFETKDFNASRTCYKYDTTRNLQTVRIEGIITGQCYLYLEKPSYAPPPGAREISTEWTPIWRLKSRVAEPLKITSYGYNGQVDPSTGSVVTCAPPNATAGGQPIGVLCRKTEQATTDVNGNDRFNATPIGSPRVWEYTYDENGKLLTANGPRTDVSDVTTYEYRSADGSGTPLSYKRGDLWKITNPASHVTDVLRTDAATGLPLEILDANGVTTLLSYDARGRLLSQQVGSETTQYEYDLAGNLTKITAPDNAYLQYTYDDAGRLTRITDRLGNYVEYTLDAAGNRTQEKTYDTVGALKRSVARQIDALSRVQQLTGIE